MNMPIEQSMNILATSPDGCLRLRQFRNGKTGVVELKGHSGRWVWCVWRSSPIERAWECYNNQVRHHQFAKATNRPGDMAAVYAEENGVDYATALVACNMD